MREDERVKTRKREESGGFDKTMGKFVRQLKMFHTLSGFLDMSSFVRNNLLVNEWLSNHSLPLCTTAFTTHIHRLTQISAEAETQELKASDGFKIIWFTCSGFVAFLFKRFIMNILPTNKLILPRSKEGALSLDLLEKVIKSPSRKAYQDLKKKYVH